MSRVGRDQEVLSSILTASKNISRELAILKLIHTVSELQKKCWKNIINVCCAALEGFTKHSLGIKLATDSSNLTTRTLAQFEFF